jgi:hypothetical protein
MTRPTITIKTLLATLATLAVARAIFATVTRIAPAVFSAKRAFDLADRAGLNRRGEDVARVQDEDVDPASLRDGAIDAGLVGHVEAQSQVRVEVIQAVRIPRSRDDAVAAPGDLDDGGSADPLGRAGNQDRGHGACASFLQVGPI